MNHFTAFFLGVLLGALIVLLMIASYTEGKKAGRREGYQPRHNAIPAPPKSGTSVPPVAEHSKASELPTNPPSVGSAAQDN